MKNTKLFTKENFLLLTSGTLLTVFSGYRWGVELFAWIAMVPFILFIMKNSGWKSGFAVGSALQLAMNLLCLKLITEPVPPIFALAFGVPAALVVWGILYLWKYATTRVSQKWWIPIYVSLITMSDWLAYAHSDFGMWGTSANWLLDNLPILQLASIGGISLITIVFSSVSISIALLLYEKENRIWKHAAIVAGLFVGVSLIWGSHRVFSREQGNSVTVAGVTTDLHLTASGVFPSEDEIREANDSLFARSKQAAKAGAKLVVWNEGATLIYPDKEKDFISKARGVAIENKIDLVVGYIVLLSESPFKYDNKYLFINGKGEQLEEYRKHHPVPGEPCIAGTEELIVHERSYGPISGAICYDFDFPEMAIEMGKKGTGLAFVPSSDWNGIDPYHTHMAKIRGIEGGFSVIRPVRWATSGAFDAYGRTRGTMPYHEGKRVMVVDVPIENIPTLYSRFGDWPILVAVAILLIAIIQTILSYTIRKK